MVIGKHDPKEAKDTTFKDAIAIGLDECFTALDEAFGDLTDEQFWGFPLAGRHNIVTLVEHCLDCLDLYGCEVQVGKRALSHETRFDIWNFSPEQVRDRMTDLPTAAAVRARLAALQQAVTANLDAASQEDLSGPRVRDAWWWEEFQKTSADAYMRAVMHTTTHVRQIGLLRGLTGLTDKAAWPEQHWA